MTWPASDVDTTDIDADTDSPLAARQDLLDLAQKFNLLRNHVTGFCQGALSSADAAAFRGTINAQVAGSYQALDAELTALAGLASAADRLPYFTGPGAAALATLTAFARSLLDDGDVATARATLGLGALAVLGAVNNSNWSGADLDVANGGTGASDAAGARANLGLGALATLNTAGQGQLNTTTGTIGGTGLFTNNGFSFSDGAGPFDYYSSGGAYHAEYTLPGGEYGLWPTVYAAGAGSVGGATGPYYGIYLLPGRHYSGGTQSAVTGVRMVLSASSSSSTWGAVFTQRYVQASPPYDLGDGEIPLFVFAEVRSDGTIKHWYIAPEAPWHYNGPTDIRADRYRNGRGFRARKALLAEFGSCKAARAAGLTQAQIVERLRNDPMIEVEVTQAIKNADMDLVPSPFLSPDAGNTIVLLDPVSPLIAQLAEIHRQDPIESFKLLDDGDIRISSNRLARRSPSGVVCVAPRWR